MSGVPDRYRQVLHLLLLGLMLLLSACTDDLCRSQPPALEVTITLAGSVKARYREIKTLQVDLSAGTTFSKSWSFKITDELDDGETSFAVALGAAGEGGFSAKVQVQAKNAKDQVVASTTKTFPGNSGDACNLLTMELGLWAHADGGAGDAGDSGPDISDAGADRSQDLHKPDMNPDTSPDTASPDTASPDTMLPDTTPPDTTPPDLCPSGDFSGPKKTCTKAADCDDKLACTVDICGGCVCYNAVKVGHCLTGGACYKAGAVNPTDKCKRCTPSTSSTNWTLSTAPGCVTTLAGDGINGSTNGPAASSRFYGPCGVAVDEIGRVYVSDYHNHKLRYVLDGKVGDWASVYAPDGVTADRFGTVFVADFILHRIEVITKGVKGSPIGQKVLDGPSDVAVDSKGMVFVADYMDHVIRKINTKNNNSVSLFAGTPGKSGHSNATPVLFNQPNGVAVDNKGSVFVADKGNHVIRRIWILNGKVSTIAGVANQKGGPDTIKFDEPVSVAVNNTGRVYVSDNGNNVIRQLQLDYSANTVGIVARRAGNGTAGFADGEARYVAMFNGPRGLTVDAFGMVHVADRLNHKVRTVHTVGYWVPLKTGKFKMGSPPSEKYRNGAVEAQHDVTLTHDFAIHTTEVTQDQFHTVMKYNPSSFKYCGGTCPVETVTWHEAVAYCNALSKKNNRTPCFSCSGSGATTKCSEVAQYAGKKLYTCPGYRLPTEAEWEYAYRAGTTTAFYNGNSTVSSSMPSPKADEIGWYCHNSKVKYNGGKKPLCPNMPDSGPHPVGAKKPNAWGLYGMAGNVLEWCHDGYKAVLPSATDPVIPKTSHRMIRGGAWNRGWTALRAAARGYNSSANNDLGFRCVRSIK